MQPPPTESGLVLRPVAGEDEELVEVLAELDSAPALTGRRLLALVDGWPVAAISLDDGRVVANPFTETTGTVALLRLRAAQLTAPDPRRERLGRERRRGERRRRVVSRLLAA